jgi:hypothetical protein
MITLATDTQPATSACERSLRRRTPGLLLGRYFPLTPPELDDACLWRGDGRFRFRSLVPGSYTDGDVLRAPGLHLRWTAVLSRG